MIENRSAHIKSARQLGQCGNVQRVFIHWWMRKRITWAYPQVWYECSPQNLRSVDVELAVVSWHHVLGLRSRAEDEQEGVGGQEVLIRRTDKSVARATSESGVSPLRVPPTLFVVEGPGTCQDSHLTGKPGAGQGSPLRVAQGVPLGCVWWRGERDPKPTEKKSTENPGITT